MTLNEQDLRLVRVFGLINEWLRYAEVKNGVLVTFNGALIMGLHQQVTWHRFEGPWFGIWLWVATAFFMASLLVGLSSFYALTRTFGFHKEAVSADGEGNAIFYGHLAHMTRAQVLLRLVDGPGNDATDAYLNDLADQVIINAKIANRKFALFNLAFHLTICGLITPAGCLLYYWKFCDEKI